jgi:enterochelin esterase-like enzyme
MDADNRAVGRLRAPVADRVRSPRVGELSATLRSGDRAALASFWDEVDQTGAPLIEDVPECPDERIYTFVWQGEPGTQDVLLLANRITDRRDLSACALARIPDTDVWHISFRMGADWQASYQFGPDFPPLIEGARVRGTAAGPNRAGAEDVEQPLDRLLDAARPDPRARSGLPSLWNGPAMSAVAGPGALASPVWVPRERQPVGTPRGSVTEFSLGWGSALRDVWVYEPARTDVDKPLDLLLMLDGQIWAGVADLPAALDVLIASGELDPVLVVMPSGLDGPARTDEFACDPGFIEVLRTQLLPWVADRYPVTAASHRRIIAGQSMGGLAAVWTATTAPDLFGAAASQSGSFWWRSHDPLDADAEWLTKYVSASAPRVDSDARIDLAVGTRESLLTEPTRRLAEVLRERGTTTSLTEVNGGHDLLWWRHALVHALGRLLPPTD